MTPRTVRLRVSSVSCSTSALRPVGSRDTLSVWLSLRRRSSPRNSASWCLKRSRSPGRRLSSIACSPGTARSVARSARLSLRRLKIRSSVSLRVTVTSMVESARRASASVGTTESCTGAEALRATAAGGCAPGVAARVPPVAAGTAMALGGAGAPGAPALEGATALEGAAAVGAEAPSGAGGAKAAGGAMVSGATGGDCASGGAPGGAIVIPPCITDQATTAQASDCSQKAAETLWRSRESGCRVRWKVSAIDYTWFLFGRTDQPYRSHDPGSMYVKCRYMRALRAYVISARRSIAGRASRELRVNLREQILELERGASELLLIGDLVKKLERAGSASRAHRAAQQDAPVPAVRARGDLPHRGLHRDDRRPHRAQYDAPTAHARRDPGERAHLRSPGVQDPRSRAHPHRLQLALAVGAHRGRGGEARRALHRGAHARARRLLQALQERPADLDPRVSLPARAGLRLGGHARGRRARRHGSEVQSAGRPHAPGGLWAGAAGRDHDAAPRGHRRRQQDVQVPRQLHRHHRGCGQHVREADVDLGRAHVALLRAAVLPPARRDRPAQARGGGRTQSARHQVRAGARARVALSRCRDGRARAPGLNRAGEREGGAG